MYFFYYFLSRFFVDALPPSFHQFSLLLPAPLPWQHRSKESSIISPWSSRPSLWVPEVLVFPQLGKVARESRPSGRWRLRHRLGNRERRCCRLLAADPHSRGHLVWRGSPSSPRSPLIHSGLNKYPPNFLVTPSERRLSPVSSALSISAWGLCLLNIDGFNFYFGFW